jgi:hypothetical protein
MNERIRQLAKQTGYIWHASGDPQIYEFTPEKLEKFAELIVRECATIADIEKSNLAGCGYITKTKGMLIREHFGVEE